MTFSVQDALRIATANLAQRAQTRSNSYTLYYSNDGVRYDGQVHGSTIKELTEEFRRSHANYKYAFITKKDNSKLLRFHNRDVSKKFFSMTRKGKMK